MSALRALRNDPTSIFRGDVIVKGANRRFTRLFRDAASRPPADVKRITSVHTVVLSRHHTKTMVGLTRYSSVRRVIIFSRPRQTMTFYSDLLDQLSDRAAEAVIAHELAHAWLNEHVEPFQSEVREKEADRLARRWGFGTELDALDDEAETVS